MYIVPKIYMFLCQKPRPEPSQAGAKPLLAALAWPRFLQSRSRLRPGQAGPEQHYLKVSNGSLLLSFMYVLWDGILFFTSFEASLSA
jgi:hypothetical protein